jgi:hypothetical protein
VFELGAIWNWEKILFQIARSGTMMMAPMVQYLLKIRSTAPLAADDSVPGLSPPLRFAFTGDRIALQGKRSSPGDNSGSWPSYPPCLAVGVDQFTGVGCPSVACHVLKC